MWPQLQHFGIVLKKVVLLRIPHDKLQHGIMQFHVTLLDQTSKLEPKTSTDKDRKQVAARRAQVALVTHDTAYPRLTR